MFFYGFFVFPSASGSWQKEEGWLLISRCRCVQAAAGGYWVCGRCRREKVKSVAPALPCVGCWLTGEDDAAVVGGENGCGR
jgi:hypothetical protein